MAIELPKEFFTVESMLTLTGATGATFVISNGLQKAFDFNPRWLALAIAVSVCLFGVFATGGRPTDYFVGLVNGFLVYCTAAGATGMGGGGQPEVKPPNVKDGTRAGIILGKRTFLSPWW